MSNFTKNMANWSDTKYVTSLDTGEVIGVYETYERAVEQGVAYGSANKCVVALHGVAVDLHVEPGMSISMRGAVELLCEGEYVYSGLPRIGGKS